ncbi:MAG: hypothetical protein U0531_20130 [Dehalococcoidia bacterium]
MAPELAAYRDLGVGQVVVDFRSCSAEETRETMRLAAERLLPEFMGWRRPR